MKYKPSEIESIAKAGGRPKMVNGKLTIQGKLPFGFKPKTKKSVEYRLNDGNISPNMGGVR